MTKKGTGVEILTVTISPQGAAEIAVHGGQGQSCKDLTKPFIDALGVVERTADLPEAKHRPLQQSHEQAARVNA